MKHISFILTFLVLSSCNKFNSHKNFKHGVSTEADSVEMKVGTEIPSPEVDRNSTEQDKYDNQNLSYEFKNAAIFKLTDTLKADFNGDGKLDQALFKIENETSGIVLAHGETNEIIKIGFGVPFGHLTQFNWVDYWGLVNDSETFEIVIQEGEIIGGKEVKLDNPSIFVRKEEVGGGIITFKSGKYIWIHQSD